MFILLRNLAGGRQQEWCSLRGTRAIWRFFKGKFTKGVSEKGVVLDVRSGTGGSRYFTGVRWCVMCKKMG